MKVPTTLAEYCIKTKVPSNDNSSDLLYDDLYDDDIDDEDEEEEDADCYDDDDSGNEESWRAPSVPRTALPSQAKGRGASGDLAVAPQQKPITGGGKNKHGSCWLPLWISVCSFLWTS